MIALVVLLRGFGGGGFPDVLGLMFLLGPGLVVGGLLFGLLLAVVRLSRSTVSGSHQVAVLLALGFLLVSIFIAQSAAPAFNQSLPVDAVLVISVGGAGVLLVVAVAMGSSSWQNSRLATWGMVMIAASLLLGALGLFGYSILNIPVQEMAVVEGIGPRNYDRFALVHTAQPGADRPIPDRSCAWSHGMASDRADQRRCRNVGWLCGSRSERDSSVSAERRLVSRAVEDRVRQGPYSESRPN